MDENLNDSMKACRDLDESFYEFFIAKKHKNFFRYQLTMRIIIIKLIYSITNILG